MPLPVDARHAMNTFAAGYARPGGRDIHGAMADQDLNLLVALDALLTEGSVAGAARRRNLSASAVSRELADSVAEALARPPCTSATVSLRSVPRWRDACLPRTLEGPIRHECPAW